MSEIRDGKPACQRSVTPSAKVFLMRREAEQIRRVKCSPFLCSSVNSPVQVISLRFPEQQACRFEERLSSRHCAGPAITSWVPFVGRRRLREGLDQNVEPFLGSDPAEVKQQPLALELGKRIQKGAPAPTGLPVGTRGAEADVSHRGTGTVETTGRPAAVLART